MIDQPRSSRGIVLGDNVWLGTGAKVLDGVRDRQRRGGGRQRGGERGPARTGRSRRASRPGCCGTGRERSPPDPARIRQKPSPRRGVHEEGPRTTWSPCLAPARRDPRFTTISGRPDRAGLPPVGRGRPRLRAGPRRPRPVPVHPRHPRDDVPRQGLDDAAVRRLRQRRPDERPLQVPARARQRRALGRVRPADPDGPRPRPPALARRGGQVRGRRLLAPGHGDAVRRASRSTASRPR